MLCSVLRFERPLKAEVAFESGWRFDSHDRLKAIMARARVKVAAKRPRELLRSKNSRSLDASESAYRTKSVSDLEVLMQVNTSFLCR